MRGSIPKIHFPVCLCWAAVETLQYNVAYGFMRYIMIFMYHPQCQASGSFLFSRGGITLKKHDEPPELHVKMIQNLQSAAICIRLRWHQRKEEGEERLNL